MEPRHALTAILPANDLDASEAFYRRLGFIRANDHPSDPVVEDYRILTDGQGATLHLTRAESGWLIPGRNPFGLYLATPEVDELAARTRDLILEKDGPQVKPWGMYEFSLSDPDETLVRVGWPARGHRHVPASRETSG